MHDPINSEFGLAASSPNLSESILAGWAAVSGIASAQALSDQRNWTNLATPLRTKPAGLIESRSVMGIIMVILNYVTSA